MDTFQVVVGNVGTVYSGDDVDQAYADFNEYSDQSTKGYGRAAGQDVTLFIGGEPLLEAQRRGRRGRNRTVNTLSAGPQPALPVN